MFGSYDIEGNSLFMQDVIIVSVINRQISSRIIKNI